DCTSAAQLDLVLLRLLFKKSLVLSAREEILEAPAVEGELFIALYFFSFDKHHRIEALQSECVLRFLSGRRLRRKAYRHGQQHDCECENHFLHRLLLSFSAFRLQQTESGPRPQTQPVPSSHSSTGRPGFGLIDRLPGLLRFSENRIELSENVIVRAVLVVATPARAFGKRACGWFSSVSKVEVGPAFLEFFMVLECYFDACPVPFEISLLVYGDLLLRFVDLHYQHGLFWKLTGSFEISVGLGL